MTGQSRKDIAKVIADKTADLSKDELIKSVASYLVGEHSRLNVDDLMRDIMHYRAEKGIVEAVVISAHEITGQVMSDVEAYLKEHYPEAKKFVINSRIDPSVIGGVKIEMPRETIDLTVKSKLNKFKQLIEEKN